MAAVLPHGLGEIVDFYGDPRPFVNDKAAWEREALVLRPLPTPLVYAYDPRQSVTRVRAHRLVADELRDILMECLGRGVPAARMKYGGVYAWRAQRGASVLSLHTWAVAIDLDPAENPLGEPWVDDGVRLDPRIIDTFVGRGWVWGGNFHHRPDPQHCQRASGY